MLMVAVLQTYTQVVLRRGNALPQGGYGVSMMYNRLTETGRQTRHTGSLSTIRRPTCEQYNLEPHSSRYHHKPGLGNWDRDLPYERAADETPTDD